MGNGDRATARGALPVTQPRVAFYGDDFTGSTDTLAAAVQGGWRAALFMDVPSAEDLRRHGVLDCIGVAGSARSLSPAGMDQVLPRIFAGLAATGARVLHYKTCSTFDSAPHIGSIGHAAMLARAALPGAPRASGTRPVYIVGGQPNLGRYCAYANLYARAGQDGAIYRIDRHPTMRHHPVTPMDEADLRVHLGRQGLRPRSFDAEMLELPEAQQDAHLDAMLRDGAEALLFDVTRSAHLAAIGRLLWARCSDDAPLLALGPTGVVQALLAAPGARIGTGAAMAPGVGDGAEPASAATDASRESLFPAPIFPASAFPAPVAQTFIVAGSRSPVTAAQIARAVQDGFVSIAADPAALARHGEDHDDSIAAGLVGRIVDALAAGRSVVAHTTLADAGAAARPGYTQALAVGSGRLMREVLARHPLRRVGFAGGDTSSLAVQSWGIAALTLAYVLAPGVAVCRIDAPGQALDGVELMLKGGQMGPPALFRDLLAGSA